MRFLNSTSVVLHIFTIAGCIVSASHTAHGAVVITAVGGGSGYDEAAAVSAGFRSTNVAKGFDVDDDNAYGTAGSFFYGNGTNATSNSDNTPSWATVTFVEPSPVVLAGYTKFDDPTLPIAPTVVDWGNTGFSTINTGGAGAWTRHFDFSIDANTPQQFRLGVMAGIEPNSDGRWDPTGIRMSFGGGTETEITSLAITSLGMVFFDVTVTDGTTGTVSIDAQRRLGIGGSGIAGVTFDFPTVPEPSAFVLVIFGSLGLACGRFRKRRVRS